MVRRGLATSMLALLLAFVMVPTAMASTGPIVPLDRGAQLLKEGTKKAGPALNILKFTPHGRMISTAAVGISLIASTPEGQAMFKGAWSFLSGKWAEDLADESRNPNPNYVQRCRSRVTGILDWGEDTNPTYMSYGSESYINVADHCSGVNPRWTFVPRCRALVTDGSGLAGIQAGDIYGGQGMIGSVNETTVQQSSAAHICDRPNVVSAELIGVYADGTVNGSMARNFQDSSWHPHPERWTQADAEMLSRVETRKRCVNPETGAVTSVWAEGQWGDERVISPECPPGTVAGSMDSWLRGAGMSSGPAIKLLEARPTDQSLEDHADCWNQVNGPCEMWVEVDGTKCTAGTAACVDWWNVAQQSPDRVDCRWGAYTLTAEDCHAIRHLYVTGEVVADPDRPPDAAPVPVTGRDPNDNPVPAPPGFPGDEPTTPTLPDVEELPDYCPPSSYPAMEAGLQPVARMGLRCAVFEYPGIIPTSGYRPDADQWSDHDDGLAVDFSVPNWSDPAGNRKLWELAQWGVRNRSELGIGYVIFDGLRWPAYDGTPAWVPYEHPGGNTSPSGQHKDHVHMSFSGQPGGQPGPGPGPGTGPGTIGSGDREPEGNERDCWPNGWGVFSPAAWVLQPTKCALEWAFVPSASTLTQLQTETATAVQNSGVGTWVQVLNDITDPLEHGPEGDTDPPIPGEPADCKGPAMVLPEPIDKTIYLLDACEEPRKTLAALMKIGLGAVVGLGGAWTAARLTLAGIGYNIGGSGSGDE